MLIEILKEGILLVAILSGVPLLISTAAALLVALLQAATQVQEQSLGFLVKISLLGGTFCVGGAVFWSWCLEFFRRSIVSIQFVGG